jgi:putative transposase
MRVFKRLLRSHGGEPRKIVADKLRSHRVTHRELIPGTIYVIDRCANYRAEEFHEPTRASERWMRRFKSAEQAKRFLGLNATVYNLCNLGRQRTKTKWYRIFREDAFAE